MLRTTVSNSMCQAGREQKQQKIQDLLFDGQCCSSCCSVLQAWISTAGTVPSPLTGRWVHQVCSGIVYVQEERWAFHFPVCYVYSPYVRCTDTKTGTVSGLAPLQIQWTMIKEMKTAHTRYQHRSTGFSTEPKNKCYFLSTLQLFSTVKIGRCS